MAEIKFEKVQIPNDTGSIFLLISDFVIKDIEKSENFITFFDRNSTRTFHGHIQITKLWKKICYRSSIFNSRNCNTSNNGSFFLSHHYAYHLKYTICVQQNVLDFHFFYLIYRSTKLICFEQLGKHTNAKLNLSL